MGRLGTDDLGAIAAVACSATLEREHCEPECNDLPRGHHAACCSAFYLGERPTFADELRRLAEASL